MKTETPRYSLRVDWDDEDKIWIGRCPELFGGGVHGSDRRAVYEELCQAVDEVIARSLTLGMALPEPKPALE